MAKVILRYGYWTYDNSEYLTLEQAKTVAETAVKARQEQKKLDDLPWI